MIPLGFSLYRGKAMSDLNLSQGVLRMSDFGVKFKMLKMYFHVWQINPYVVRILQVNSLLYMGCMVEEISAKSHPKVKWGQIFNIVKIKSASMTYQIDRLVLYFKDVYFCYILTFIFEMVTFKRIVLWFQCKKLVCANRKSIKTNNHNFHMFSVANTNQTCKPEFNIWQNDLQEISKKL